MRSSYSSKCFWSIWLKTGWRSNKPYNYFVELSPLPFSGVLRPRLASGVEPASSKPCEYCLWSIWQKNGWRSDKTYSDFRVVYALPVGSVNKKDIYKVEELKETKRMKPVSYDLVVG